MLIQQCGRYEFTTRAYPYDHAVRREGEILMRKEGGWEENWASIDTTGIYVVYRRSSDAALRLATKKATTEVACPGRHRHAWAGEVESQTCVYCGERRSEVGS